MGDKTQLDRQFEIAERVYYFEHDRQEKLFSRIPVIVAIYSILLSVMASFIDSLPSGKNSLEVWLLRGGLVAEAIAIIVSSCYACRFLWFKQQYGFLVPQSTVTNTEAVQDIEQADAGEETPTGEEVEVSEETDAKLITRQVLGLYEEMASHNYLNNQDRAAYVNSALRWLIIGAGIALLTSVPYFIIKSERKQDAHKVEITNLSRIDSMIRQNGGKGKDTAKTQQKDSGGKGKASSGTKRPDSGFGAVYVRPGDTVEKSKDRGHWHLRK